MTDNADIKTLVKQTKDDEKAVSKQNLDDEPLLRENAQRFVLFPIKYHEVCDASWTRKVLPSKTLF